ncbi:MAG: hypothetical protein JKX72_06465 [Robiginitomaculum sp.]|nr:hypothetical protein [Robiginitomaculum sp.]
MRKSFVFTALLIVGTVGVTACSKPEQAAPEVADSQEVSQRIVFQPGAVSANVTGKMEGFDQELSYVIQVNGGQTMSIEQVDAGEHRITLKIIDPLGADVTDMDLGCNGSKTISPTVAGDYNIRVWECMKADPWNGEFTLAVTVK